MREPVKLESGFGRTTTEKRFIAAFGAVLLVVGVAAYLTMAGLSELHDMMHKTVETSQELIRAHRLESGVHETYAHQAHTIIMGDSSHVGRYKTAERELAARIAQAREHDAGKTEIIDAADQLRAANDSAFRERLLPAVLSRDAVSVRDEHNELLARIDKLEGLLDEETRRVETQLSGFDDHASAVAHSGFRNALVMLIGVALFTVIVGIALGRSVARPIALLHAGARQIAEGDLEARLPVTGPREFQALAAGFNDMVVATRENQARLLQNERLASIGRLAAGVAHEINNPLGVIRGYTKLVADKIEDAEIRADLQIIEDECLRCRDIVRDLLDLARPMVADGARIDLAELTRELVERMEQTDSDRGARVSVEGNALAWGDPRTLRQVLTNLLDNALESATASTVIVSLQQDDEDAIVRVVDDGPGLANVDTDRLFEPFFTTKDTGTGLGLAVSRAIARGHGGDLRAEDGEGGGAVFTLTLPTGAGRRVS